MAIVNNDICDIVKKCKILLLDIEGTTTSISFVKDELFPYAEKNVKEFLDTQWENEEVKEAVAALRKLAIEDKEKSVEGAVAIPGEDSTKDEQIEGLVNNVKWQMSSDRKVAPLKLLQGLIWKLGYDKGEIKGHVYDDVSPALELWKSTEGQKVYIYSSGSVQAQKLLFGQSVVGDLLPLIEGHFDTGVGAKQDAASYVAIAEKIGCKPEEILFLTDIVKEAEAARTSGLQVALVSREGNAPLSSEASSAFPVLHSFAQLAVSNKRKPESQEEEQPAKIPKTDVEDNVKTTNEVKTTETAPIEAKEVTEIATPKLDAPKIIVTTPEEIDTEKMEVEEEVPAEKTAETPEVKEKVEEPTETAKIETTAKVETVVEEVTDAMEVADAPMVDVEPVVEETVEKTEKSETEKMEAEPVEKEKIIAAEPKISAEEIKQDAATAEETPPAIITEIKDVTNDPETLNEVTDMDDLEPVIEEPPATEEMEELKNVGDVLEKECDEILSKVQDVTNLDTIQIKPLLNTIAEETMETENTDSNDIVDRILDTEIEMGIKTGNDVELNTEKETSKTETKNDVVDTEVTKDNAEKPAESVESSVPEAEKPKVDETPKVESISNGDAVESHSAPVEEKVDSTVKSVENVQKEEPAQQPQENTKKADENVLEAAKVETESKTEDSKVEEKAQKEETATEVAAETKETVPEEAKVEKQSEKQVNGKATNGNGEINLNGDSKDEELSARLSVDNEKEVVNGANGNKAEVEQDKGDKVEKEIPDIKVKTVATDETPTDPIEQPTEA